MPPASFRCTLLLALALGVTTQPARAGAKPLLSASTETPSPGLARPPPRIVRVVMDAVSKNDRANLDGCLVDDRLERKDYGALLSAVKIRAGARRNLWFVRPRLKPYCSALYGAHAFQYFLVDERLSSPKPRLRLVFQNGGDAFDIYPQQRRGLNDIEATGCIAGECRSARMSFDGAQYRPVLCTRRFTGKDNREVVQRRRCESDDWRDDQASGLNPNR